MTGCCDNVQDLLTSVNDPDKHIRIVYVGHPGALWQSSGCYVCECRVPLFEGIQIGETRHVYSWGNPDENVCHVWGGVPTQGICFKEDKMKKQGGIFTYN